MKTALPLPRDIFATQEKCNRAQRNALFVNCSQWVDFNADGTAEMILTDIMNRGSYNINGKDIVVSFEGFGDAQEEMDFTLIAETEIQDKNGKTWVKK